MWSHILSIFAAFSVVFHKLGFALALGLMEAPTPGSTAPNAPEIPVGLAPFVFLGVGAALFYIRNKFFNKD